MNTPPRTGSPLRPLAWLAIALVAIVAAAFVTVRVLFPPAKVRALVSAQLSGLLARDVRFADASVGLWPPVRLTVSQPGLAELGGFERGAIVEARAISLDLDVFALLSRKVVVRRLVLDRPALHLVLRADGTTNLDGIVKPQPPGRAPARPMDLAIRELRVREGRLLVDDLRSQRRTAIRIESRVALTAEAGGTRFGTSGATELSGLATGPLSAARLSDLNQGLAKLVWKIEHDGKFDAKQKRLALAKLSFALDRAEIACSGVVDDPGPHARLDLRTRGSDVDLGAVLRYVSVADAKLVHGLGGSGRLDFDLRIVGSPGAGTLPAVIGAARITNGAFRYEGAPASVEGLAFTALFGRDSLTIGDLRARIGDQPVQASLFATRFADPWVRFAVQGNVDLAAVAPMVAPKDTKLAGRAAVNVNGSGRAKDPGSVALEGEARLAGVSVQSPALPNRVEDVHGDIRFSQAKASVAGFGARAGKSSFTLDATVTRPLALLAGMPGAAPSAAAREPVAPAGVDFALRSPYLDLAELLPTTPGAPLLPNATGGGSVAIARLKNQKLDVQDVRAKVALEPGVLAVPEYSMRAYGGTSSGSARFDLRDPAKPAFAVKTQVDSLQADDVLSAWTPLKGLIHGSLGSTLDLSGAGATPADLKRTLTAVGLALVANGTFGPGPTLEAVSNFVHIPALKQTRFKDARVPFRIERGRVVTDPIVIHGPHGDWRLTGAVGFDGSLDYAVSGTLPPEISAAIGARSALAAGALSDGQGRMLLDLRVRGTAAAPQVSWDTQAMRDRIAGRVSQALEAQHARLDSTARAIAAERTHAAEDSARAAVERAKRAAADSLRRRAGDVFKGFFGGSRDTTKH